MDKKKLRNGLFAALGCVAILGALVGIPMQAKADNGPTYVADNRTLNTWDTMNMAQSTRNVGRIWTDKSVSTDSIELKYGGVTGQKVSKTEGSDFLVALSALSSASTQTTVTGAPLDIVLVMDLSGSMGDPLYSYTPIYSDSLSTRSTYYIRLDDGTYQSVTYRNQNSSWNYRDDDYDRVYVTPKTDADDNSASSVQFYTLDGSTSKLSAMKSAATQFVSATKEVNADLEADQQHRIGLVKFAGTSTDTIGDTTYEDGSFTYNHTQVVSNLTSNLDSITASINGFDDGGATRAASGLRHAQRIFAAETEDRGAHKVVIFFTDGQPNQSSGFSESEAQQAVSYAKQLKDDNTLIYTIGVFADADVSEVPTGTVTDSDFNAYMHAVSSNYPDATASYSGGSWSLSAGARAADSNYYKVAGDAVSLENVFTEIYDEIVTMPAAPTVTDSGNPQASGYVIFTDTLGAFMEFKAPNAIVYNDTVYTSSGPVGEPVLAADGKTQRYAFSGSVTDVNAAYPGSYTLDNLIIEVTTSNDVSKGDTVVVKIPSALLPLRHYDIDDQGNLIITEAHPIRVMYSVGLKAGVKDAMASGQLDSVDGLAEYVQQNADQDGKVSFYSNDFDPGSSVGKTKATFAPAATNNFYYYTEDTYLYKDAACTQPMTDISTGTFYYKHTYYELTTTTTTTTPFNAIAITVTDDNKNQLGQDSQGVYVPKGIAKVSLASAETFNYLKPAAGAAAVGGDQVANVTGTATYALSTSTAAGQANISLGNNGRITYNATGSLTVAKFVEHADNLSPDPNTEFTFQIQLTAPSTWAAGETVDGDYTYVISNAVITEDQPAGQAGEPQTLTVTNGKGTLKLKDGESATVYGLREGVTYKVTEVELPKGYTNSAVNGIAEGTIDAGTTNGVEFVNTYSVEEFMFPQGDTTFPVRKMVYAGSNNTPIEWNEGWQFSFTISASRGTSVPLPSPSTITLTDKAVNAQTNIATSNDFGKIIFTEPGTYYYLITEDEPEDAASRLPGISYTGASYEIEVTMVDNGDGTLRAVVYDDDGNEIPGKEYVIRKTVDNDGTTLATPQVYDAAEFVNIYDLETIRWTPWIQKSLDDRSGLNHAVEANRFEFYTTRRTDLEPDTNSNTVAPEFSNVTNSATGDVTFASAVFDIDDVGNTYVYEMGEVIPADADKLPGIIYDETKYLAYVSVTEDAANAAVALDVHYKRVVNGVPTDVTVTDATGLALMNIYDPEDAVVTLNVNKILQGRKWHETDEFTFTLTPETATQQAIADGKLTMGAATATATKDAQSVSFGDITFNKVGTYAFRITENVPDDPKGITYDTRSSRVVVTVTSGGMGVLTANVVYDNDSTLTASTFTNTYSAASLNATNLFPVAKDFTGRAWKAGDAFIYRLILGNGNADATPVQLNYTSYIGTASGSLPTAAFTYTPVYKYDPDGTGTDTPFHGPYVYYIYERMGTGNPDDRNMLPGVTYDRHAYKMEVWVTDLDENGVPTGQMRIKEIKYYRSTDTLSTDPSLPLKGLADMQALAYELITTDAENLPDGKTMVFHNTYAASEVTLQGTTALQGLKTFVGRDMAAGESFNFTLKPDEDYGDAVVFAQGADTASVSGITDNTSRAFSFGAVTFKAPGTYSFSVTETRTGDEDAWLTMDSHVGKVVVTVTDDLKGNLVATTVYDGDPNSRQSHFINTWFNPNEAKSVVSGEGVNMDGALVKPGQELTFTIDWVNNAVVDGKPAAATVVITDAIPANTTFVSASGNVTPVDGTLTWTVDAAAGDFGSVSFTVKVNTDNFSIAAGDTVPKVENQAGIKIGNDPEVKTNTTETDIPIKTVKETVNTGVQVGDVLTFTIGYSNPTGETADVVITDILSAGLTYVDGSYVVPAGVVFENVNNSLSWTIANVPAGAEDSVTFQARVTEDAPTTENDITNTASVKVGNAPSVDTNTTKISLSDPGDLTVSKEVTAADGITAPDATFTFRVDMVASDDQPLTGTYSYSGSTAGTIVSGGTVTLKKGQSVTIADLPAGAKVTVTEINIPNGFKPVQSEFNLTVAENSTVSAAYSNTFTHATLDADTVAVTKHLLDNFNNGNHITEWAEEYTFTFRLEAEDANTPMPAGSVDGVKTVTVNEAVPTANFGDIIYTAAGEYEYSITELRPASSYLGVSYSSAKFRLYVSVKNVEGKLVATRELYQVADDQFALDSPKLIENGTAVFHNEYKLTDVSWSPSIIKTLVNNSGQTLDASKFPFIFRAEAVTADAPIPDAPTGSVTGSGRPTFPDVVFDQDDVGNTYIYKFTEQAGSLPGVTYDNSVYYAQVVVTSKAVDGTEGAVHIEVSYYKEDGGNDSISYQDGETKIITGLTKVIPAADGTQSMSFVNTYTPAATSATVQVSKVIDGRDWLTGETYTFRLVGVDGAPMPGGDTELTVEVGKGETKSFSLSFNKVGTYHYQVNEVVPQTKAGGITYDTVVRDVYIVVTDQNAAGNYTGQLAATVTTDGVNAVAAPLTFTNVYRMAPLTVSDLFPVNKVISGRSWRSSDSFTFELAAVTSGAPMPANTSAVITGQMADKTANFGSVEFTAPGEYVYTVKEKTDAIGGISYDTAVYTVRVLVIDNGDGTMSAVSQIQLPDPADNSKTVWYDLELGDLTFVNTYSASSVQAYLNVNKTFRGVEEWKVGYDFTFTLKAITPGAPMPASDSITIAGDDTTGTVSGIDKSAAFAAITFTKAGTYEYSISEVLGSTEYVIYDRVPVKAVVTVRDDGTGQLKASVTYDDQAAAGALFVNFYSEYDHSPKSVTNVTKNGDGALAGPGDILEYTIRWANKTGQDNTTVTIVDTIPAGTTYVIDSASNADNLSVSEDGKTLTWIFENQPAGTAGRITFRVEVDKFHTGGEIKNVGYINGVSTTEAVTFVPGKTIVTRNEKPGVGETITYRINYRNTEDGPVDVSITDELDPRLTYVSGSTGASYDMKNHTVTWVIKNVAAGASGSVTLNLKLNESAIATDINGDGKVDEHDIEAIPNDSIVQIGHLPEIETNEVEVPEVPSANLTVSKTIQLVADQGTAVNTDQVFTFTIELRDAGGTVINGAFPYRIYNGDTAGDIVIDPGIKHNDTFTLKHGQKLEIIGLPVGTNYTVIESPVDNYTVQGTAAREGIIADVTDLAPEAAAALNTESYINVYEPGAATVSISVIKDLTGRDWTENDSFTFALERIGAAPMPAGVAGDETTVIATSAAAVSFGQISFKNAGTYLYKVTEAVPTTNPANGVTYDTTAYYVQVVVADVDGQMQATVTYGTNQDAAGTTAGDTVTFHNTYAVEPLTVESLFPVVKVVTGIDAWGTDWSFAFTVTALDGAPAPAETSVSIETDTSGRIANFGSATYEKAGEYLYTVQETAGSIGGITYDTTVYQVKVIVTDNGNGTMAAVSQVLSGDTWVDLTSLTFTNSFKEATANIEVVKNFNDWSKAPNGFGFKLEAVDGAPMPAVTEIVVHDGNAVAFGPIAYKAAGTYKYKVSEIIPADANKIYGVTYDTSEQEITVTVSVDGNGALVAEASAAAVFTNTFTAPTKAVDNTSVGIGQEVTFTITYVNTTGSAATIEVIDNLADELDFVSAVSDIGTAVVTPEGQQVKITISDVPAGAEGKVTLKAKVNEKALLGDITNTAFVNGHTTNTVTIEKVLPANLSFTKVIELTPGQNTTIDTNKEFTFTVQLKNAGGNSFADTATYTYQIDGVDAGTVANGGTITLKHGQTATIVGLPKYTQYILTETAANGYSVKDTGVLSGVVDSEIKAITVTNVYSASAATINLQAAKVVNGAPEGLDPTGQFAFSVYDNESCTGTPVATGNNGAGGAVNFSDITVTAAGEYTYYIKENGNSDAKHITFDGNVYKAVVTVSDNGQGQLTADVAYSTGTVPTFVNTYAPGYVIGGFDVVAQKYLSGRDMNAGEFDFGIYNASGDMIAAGTNNASGVIDFTIPVATLDLTPEEPEVKEPVDITAEFKQEAAVNAFIATKDTAVFTAEELELLAKGQAAHVQITVTNAGDKVTQEQKDLVTAALADQTVTDTVWLEIAMTKTMGSEPVHVNALSESATVTFSGVAGYRVAQIVGSDIQLLEDLDGADNDTVTVRTQNMGIFVLIAAQDNVSASEEPADEVPGDEVPGDEVPGDELPGDEVPGDEVPGDEVPGDEVPGDEVPGDEVPGDEVPDGKVRTTPEASLQPLTVSELTVLTTLTYDIPATTVGEHWYTIREIDPGLGGITYDKTEYKVHVVVVLDSGELICKPTYYKVGADGTSLEPATAIVFNNSYSAKATEAVTISGTKVLEGRDQVAGEFTFRLQGNGTELTATNNADGSFNFQVGPFDKAGTYSYTISEDEGDLLFVIYSKDTFQVDVVVTDDGLGQLHAEVKYPEDEVVSFLNVYDRPTPDPIHVTISGSKVLEGRELVEGEFAFLLKGNSAEYTATNAADGSFSFQVGPIAQAGTYTYTLTEKSGNVPYVTYSTDSFTIQVVVTETIDARLVADVQYVSGAPKFVNKFVEPIPDPIQVTLEATKTLTGRELGAKEFYFQVYDSTGKVVAGGFNDKDGKINLEAITFKTEGTYSLRVVEVRGIMEGVTYDSRAFTVVVEVTKTDDYKLVAKVHYDEEIVFKNTYIAPIPDGSNPGTGDEFNLFLMIALCIISGAAIVVLPMKRRWLL